MKSIVVLFLCVSMLILTACANSPYSKGQQGAGIGAATGAVVGQAIGRSTEATLIGAAVGTLFGYIVGNEMDKFDRQELNHAYEFTPSGQTTQWRNPDSGNYYEVTPEPAYRNPTVPGSPCREAEILTTIDGKAEKTIHTACRNERGQWVLQN